MSHHHINYLELPASDLDPVKAFFSSVFGWQFTDYGPDYVAFENAGLAGGFFRAPLASRSEQGAALPVLYSQELEATQQAVEAAGGKLHKPIFAFPGGRRFHFLDPAGNEWAVWSDRV
ncbi:VOC family protein [Ferrimonas balearica]|uniref:VOC family protein n=1 Tax=Ferrimonas balearica TaxID=44012 RepID=UPI001C98FC60|nr:VOC family protein [Ferrimonas balearica]MBY5921037.1 VOC family protein [Ferrimonas balearica]MBY5996278.1 VOC family protein [Ferrimonas balearica]